VKKPYPLQKASKKPSKNPKSKKQKASKNCFWLFANPGHNAKKQ